MAEVAVIGIDLAKRIFQVHGPAADGAVMFRRKVSRERLLPFLAAWPRCIVAMEAELWLKLGDGGLRRATYRGG